MAAGPKSIKGGIDSGKMWESIAIQPSASPRDAGHILLESFNDEWVEKFVSYLEQNRRTVK